jgi:hypothetical protein
MEWNRLLVHCGQITRQLARWEICTDRHLRAVVLLDPTTYSYWNSTFQRNQEPPTTSNGYSTDLISQRTLGFIKEARDSDRPFFIGVAPIAPHSKTAPDYSGVIPYFISPDPAQRHKDMFPNAKAPRTGNFNPDTVRRAPDLHRCQMNKAWLN